MARAKKASRKSGLAEKETPDHPKRKREVAAEEVLSNRTGDFPSIFRDQDGEQQQEEEEQGKDRPSKKAKTASTDFQATSHQAQQQIVIPSSIPTSSAPPFHQSPPQIHPTLDISPTHQTTPVSISPSSQIEKKASRILSILSTFSFSDPTPHVVLLSSKASVGCKLVTVAEIVKRELAKSDKKWYQYNVIGAANTSMPRTAEAENEAQGDVEMQDDEEAFETMKTPFERALGADPRPKMKRVATLSLYLSRVRIESLKKLYGEQTNALT